METILIYYKYVRLENPHAQVTEQRELCERLGLKGRIYIAHEGINGTVGGTLEATNAYKEVMNSHPYFSDIDFKDSPGTANHFPRLQITAKKQIVNFGSHLPSAEKAGIRLSPEEAHALFSNKPNNLVIIDTRNNYESRVGAFEGAIIPDIDYFRELPDYLDKHLEDYKGKKVVMYCTAGIRCERATAYLKEKNVAEEVYHIKGGIHRYIEQYPDGFFRGKNYVFDGRVSQSVNDSILSTCEKCNIPFDDYSNCINSECNKQIILCHACIDVYHATCSHECADLVRSHKVRIKKVKHTLCMPLQHYL